MKIIFPSGELKKETEPSKVGGGARKGTIIARSRGRVSLSSWQGV